MRKFKLLCISLVVVLLLTAPIPVLAEEEHIHTDECEHEWVYVEEHEHTEECDHIWQTENVGNPDCVHIWEYESEHIHDDDCQHSDEAITAGEDQEKDDEPEIEAYESENDDPLSQLSEAQINSYNLYNSETTKFVWTPSSTLGINWTSYSGSLQLESLYDTKSVKPIAEGVTDSFSNGKRIYFVVKGTELYTMTSESDSPTLIYSGKSVIDQICGDEEAVFFYSENRIYRYHLKSTVLDEICETGEIVFFRPYNNKSVYWTVETGMTEDIDGTPMMGLGFYFYDGDLGQLAELPADYDAAFMVSGSLPDLESAASVGNISIPYANYTVGRHFNDSNYVNSDGTWSNSYACGGHPCSGGCDFYGGCFCTSWDSSIQCMGFAKFIFEKMWGFKTSSAVQGGSNITASADFFRTIPVGSYIRSGGSHSWIVSANTGSGIEVYEANNPSGTCQINIRTYTYGGAAEAFRHIDHYFLPVRQHTHSYGGWQSNGSEHWRVCTVTNCGYQADRSSHTPGSWVNAGANHYRNCSVCSYRLTTANHNYTVYSNTSSTQHKISCVCGAYTTGSHGSWRYSSLGGGTHAKTCGYNCGYSTSEGHSLSITSRTSTHHTYACAQCSHTNTVAHTFTAVNIGTMHTRTCSVCSYANTSSHTYGSWGYLSTTQHRRICTVAGCGATQVANHSFTTTNNGSSGHSRRCGTCGYGVTSAHSGWTYGTNWSMVSTASTCRRRLKYCGVCSYSEWDYDYSHNYPLIGKQCKDCNYKKP